MGIDIIRRFNSTTATTLPKGTQAQREGSPVAGDQRFNTTLNLMEYYTGNVWKAIDSPPTVSAVSPSNFDAVNDDILASATVPVRLLASNAPLNDFAVTTPTAFIQPMLKTWLVLIPV